MSYLAAAVANPINIDADVTYNYVIPQQGASEITVDDLADFTLAITFGSPALLTVKFTGTPGAVAAYYTATIRLLTIDGALTQNLVFRVLPTFATQRVPNLTNARSAHVALGQRLSIKLHSDIDATITASGLPAGLSVANEHIIGDAPTSSGFNVITLIATAAGYVYKRYFVLIVGTGDSPEAQSFFAYPPGVVP